MNKSLMVAVLMLLPLTVSAQFKDRLDGPSLQGIVLNPGLGINTSGPFLDPSRMSWSQSVEMGYASGGGGSVGTGLYMSQLDYQLGATMDLRLQLGVHSLFHNSVVPGATGENLVGGAEFRWQPSEHFEMRLGISRGMAPAQSWGMPWYGWNASPFGQDSFSNR